MLDETVQCLHLAKTLRSWKISYNLVAYLVQNNGGCCQEVLHWIGLANSVMDSFSTTIWHCKYLCRRTKIWIFKSHVLPISLYGFETKSFSTRDFESQIDTLGNECLWKIVGCCWNVTVSSHRLLHESDLTFITCTVHQRQLQLYGHVAVQSDDQDPDPHHQTVLCKKILSGGSQKSLHGVHGFSKSADSSRRY